MFPECVPTPTLSTGNQEYVPRVVTPLRIGSYPTPVFRAEALSSTSVELWIKNDGKTAEPYGGNKVRKLEWLLAEARAKTAERIVTAGAAGSHHVLATALYAKKIGLSTVAVLCPQTYTDHARDTLRASLGTGLELHAVGSMAEVPLGIARVISRRDYVILPGGTSRLSTQGYVTAMEELGDQVKRGELPEPDVIVAAMGSGGTVAGILAGVVKAGIRSRVVGVSVAAPVWLARRIVLALAKTALRRHERHRIEERLTIDGGELGDGYGHPTESGERATRVAADVGLTLEPTYTAKTFAHVLRLLQTGSERSVLYVHTLSDAHLSPLLVHAPVLGPNEERLFSAP
jgi:1-aminocyclopropane-1-carboxylate deaminase/D-cysteine desulfhydrase-like pyridoxal-dependent ACC family enzyme